MTRSAVVRVAIAWSVAAAYCAAAAAPAFAQGKGNAFGRGRSGSPSATASPSKKGSGSDAAASADGGADAFHSPFPSGTGVRNFGAWLDDASVLPAGMGWTGLAVGYWRTPGFREIDVPMMDAGLGLGRGVQVGFSVPVYHVGEPGAPLTRGLGDLYFNAKIQLRDPSASANGLGFAVVPVLEVLSFTPASGGSRMQWALPVSMELQRGGWRTFASAGYFSRGSLFAALGLEAALADNLWAVATVTQSHSVHADEASAALGLAQTRTDVSGGLTVAVTPAISVFGSVGRTVSRPDVNSTTLSLTGGFSYSFLAWNRGRS